MTTKLRIQSGKPVMQQQDYDAAWKKIVNEKNA
jgi:hypothetical protein